MHVVCEFGWISSPFPDLRPKKQSFVSFLLEFKIDHWSIYSTIRFF